MASELKEPADRRCIRVRVAAVGVAAALTLLGLAPIGGTARGAEEAGTAAHRLILWTNCERDVLPLTDAELDEWKCARSRRLRLHDRAPARPRRRQDFSGDPDASLSGRATTPLQRSLRDSRIVDAGEGAWNEALSRRQARQLLQRRNPAQGLVRRRRLVEGVAAEDARPGGGGQASRLCRDRPRPGALSLTGGRGDRDLGLGLPGQHPLRGTGASEGKAARRRADEGDPRGLSGCGAGDPPRPLSRRVARVRARGRERRGQHLGPTASTSTSGTG